MGALQEAGVWGRPRSWSPPAVRAERFVLAALVLSTFGLLVSDRVVVLGDVAAIGLVLAVVASGGLLSRHGALIGICLYVLVVCYILSSFGSNFPGWYPALLGIRKALPPWIFLAVGAAWPGNCDQLIRRLVLILTAACAVSLALHQFAPGIEDGISRSANTYTALYSGVPRLQGVFAGPFHAALAGTSLVIASLGFPHLFRRRTLRFVVAGVGLLAIDQSSVRAGWVAMLVGVLVVFALRPARRLSPRLLRLVAVAMALFLGAATNAQSLVLQNNAALESLTHWRSDSRLLNRVETYREAETLIGERPLTGWGPGSASDTLGRYFVGGKYVTPHNLILGYAVEAGVFGALAVVAMLVIAGVSLLRASRRSALAAGGFALLFGFVVFGATGTAVDAAPVSWFVLFIVGLAIQAAVRTPRAALSLSDAPRRMVTPELL